MSDLTRAAVLAQPAWLRALDVAERLPGGARVVFTGCGTSFHAAQTGGGGGDALEAAAAAPEADILVAVSHEGETYMTTEAVARFPGRRWLVTGNPEGRLA